MTFHPFFIYLNAYFTAFQLINLKPKFLRNSNHFYFIIQQAKQHQAHNPLSGKFNPYIKIL